MPTWTLKADRRQLDYESLTAPLRQLERSIQGLHITLRGRRAFDAGRDAGDLRDFAPIADLSHQSTAALEIVAEELLAEFGWRIDLERPGSKTDR